MEQTKIALENILKKPDYARLIFMASTGKYCGYRHLSTSSIKGRSQETKTAPVNEKKRD
jgi:hypothetical protein